jgi:hypothetical protein
MSLSLRGRCNYRRCEYRKIQHEQAVFHALIRSTAAFRSKLRIVSGGPGVKFWFARFASDPSDEFHAAPLTSLSRNSTKNVAANALGSDCNLYSSGSCRVLSVELVYQVMAN